MNNEIIKCPHCKKVFFNIGNKDCPHCKKDTTQMIGENDLPDIFKDIFGDFRNRR